MRQIIDFHPVQLPLRLAQGQSTGHVYIQNL